MSQVRSLAMKMARRALEHIDVSLSRLSNYDTRTGRLLQVDATFAKS